MAYFTTMQGLGFSQAGLIGLNNKKGVSPLFNGEVGKFNLASPVLGNQNLDLTKQLQDNNVCTPDTNIGEFVPQVNIDWLWIT
jgi:hypothetical protein